MAVFIDRAQIHARAGDGGAGAVSFRREAHVAEGGPDGGDGGRGGDVWLVADRNCASLLGFKDHPHRAAGHGAHGSGKKRHGARGNDVVVAVPVGTVVTTLEGAEVGYLASHGDRLCVAEGGRGGHGNARFLSNARRAPSFAEQGERGQERWCNLELKLAADVALVGFPNVGKSTLISAISAAKPKVADYPFTTLEPHLGVVRPPGDGVEFVVADIPGLIEGAAEGRGLGLEFLRHVERASILLLLLDCSPLAPEPPQRQLEILRAELGAYLPELLERPSVVVASKIDIADAATVAEAAAELEISAVTRRGLDTLVGALAQLVASVRAVEAETDDYEPVVHRPIPVEVEVVATRPGAFEVVGRAATRAVGLSDLSNAEAMDEVLRRLERLGLDRLLKRAGARDGDEVTIGGFSFTWFRAGSAAAIDAEAEARDASRPRRRTKAERGK